MMLHTKEPRQLEVGDTYPITIVEPVKWWMIALIFPYFLKWNYKTQEMRVTALHGEYSFEAEAVDE